MPIFRCRSKLVYYAHVPKCAGSAVNRYLAARFGAIAFQDERFLLRPTEASWTRSSPQHVDRHALERLFPQGFLDESFTIVRHPVDRVLSVFAFQKEVERTIPRDLGFSEWLEELPDLLQEDPFAFDNHARPMDDLVPEGARAFKLEEGFGALIAWLDALQGEAAGARQIAPANRRSDRRGRGGASPPRPSEADRRAIEALYARDFARFGYAPEPPGRASEAAPSDPSSLRVEAGDAHDDAAGRPGWLASLLGRG